jgi:hypothetical protein
MITFLQNRVKKSSCQFLFAFKNVYVPCMTHVPRLDHHWATVFNKSKQIPCLPTQLSHEARWSIAYFWCLTSHTWALQVMTLEPCRDFGDWRHCSFLPLINLPSAAILPSALRFFVLKKFTCMYRIKRVSRVVTHLTSILEVRGSNRCRGLFWGSSWNPSTPPGEY